MKKNVITLLIVVLATGYLWAQPKIHIGATTAVNSTIVFNEGLKTDPRYGDNEFTAQWSPIGFSFGTDFSRGFGLQLEALLNKQEQITQIAKVASQAGSTIEKIKSGEQKLSMNYLQLPLLMKFMNKSSAKTRFNFNFGPQLSLLTKAQEVATFDPGEYQYPEGESPDLNQFPDATQVDVENNIWDLPSGGQNEIIAEADNFRNAMFSIAGGFGLDIDVSRNFYLTTYTRFNYAFQDVRNEDFFNSVVGGNVNQLLESSGVLDISIQLGIHYMVGGVRSFL